MPDLLSLRQIHKSYRLGASKVQVVDAVDLDVRSGECLGLVGESGSGKTTLALCAMGLVDVDSGGVEFAGQSLDQVRGAALRTLRRQFQMVFQNSSEAFDPRLRVFDVIAEPLRILGRKDATGLATEVGELLADVGLAASMGVRYPHQLSGGQRQRLGIARALATRPRLLILDEPVSALDVSVRAQILALLSDLKRRHDLTVWLISHDLATVAQLADRLAVMYRGRIVEIGTQQAVCGRPRHPYSASLFAAVPSGTPPISRPPLSPPVAARGTSEHRASSDGCAYVERCPVARTLGEGAEDCRRRAPQLAGTQLVEPLDGEETGEDVERQVACHHPLKTW